MKFYKTFYDIKLEKQLKNLKDFEIKSDIENKLKFSFVIKFNCLFALPKSSASKINACGDNSSVDEKKRGQNGSTCSNEILNYYVGTEISLQESKKNYESWVDCL